tara:strand:+ start:2367 stop:2606 length:240 start_codon:yes stop_codon:yes gene_type:complete
MKELSKSESLKIDEYFEIEDDYFNKYPEAIKPILIAKLANVDQADAYLMILDAYKKNKHITTKDQDDHYDGQVITIKNG